MPRITAEDAKAMVPTGKLNAIEKIKDSLDELIEETAGKGFSSFKIDDNLMWVLVVLDAKTNILDDLQSRGFVIKTSEYTSDVTISWN